MMLSTKARYAVMAMVYIASHDDEGRPVSLSEVSESQSISLSFLEQIFILLRGNGLVRSVRGPGGGYRLMRPAEDVRISDVILAVEEPIKMTRCMEKSPQGCLHDKSRCLTHELWEGLGDVIYNYFKNISLRDVCNRRQQKNERLFDAELSPIVEFASAK